MYFSLNMRKSHVVVIDIARYNIPDCYSLYFQVYGQEDTCLPEVEEKK